MNTEQGMSNDEVNSKKQIGMYTVWCTSKFIIPCSIFDIQK